MSDTAKRHVRHRIGPHDKELSRPKCHRVEVENPGLWD